MFQVAGDQELAVDEGLAEPRDPRHLVSGVADARWR